MIVSTRNSCRSFGF